MIPILKKIGSFYGYAPSGKKLVFNVTDTGSVQFSLRGESGCSIFVDWGDGSSEDEVVFEGVGVQKFATHDYSGLPGTKVVKMRHGSGSGLDGVLLFFASITMLSAPLSNFGVIKYCKYIYLTANSISGNIDSLNLEDPLEIYLSSSGIGGDAGYISRWANIDQINLSLNSLSYTEPSGGFPAWNGAIINLSSCGFTTEIVDSILIALATAGITGCTVNLAGSNAVRSSASDTAMGILLIAGNVITVNE